MLSAKLNSNEDSSVWYLAKLQLSQNITRDIEIKNNLTIARGEGGRDNGGKGFQELL